MARHKTFYPDPVGAKKAWGPRYNKITIASSLACVTDKDVDAAFFRSLEEAGIPLNEQQVRAVRHGVGPARVVAGAGSGKTRVLKERVAYLIRHMGVDPGKIMMLTFANKAASEMRRRLSQDPEIGQLADKILCGTFHSIFLRLIRGRGYQDRVLGEDECKEYINAAITKFSRSGGRMKSEDITEYIGKWKRGGNEVSNMPARTKQEAELKKVSLEYELAKKRNRGIDFDDILLIALREIQDDPVLKNNLQESIQFILVDEFQDTSEIQFMLLQCLLGKHQNLFIVGDPDQSIYRYAGAGTFMEDFATYYPSVMEYALTVNYRSNHWVVEMGNQIIECNPNRLPKRMVSLRQGDQGPQYIRPINPATEAELISEDVHRRILEGQDPSTIAILYRAYPIAGQLLESLIAKEIPIEGDYLEPTVYESGILRPIIANIECALRPTSEALQEVLTSLWVPKERTIEWLAENGSEGRVLHDVLACPFITFEEKMRIKGRIDLICSNKRPEEIIQEIVEGMFPHTQHGKRDTMGRNFTEGLEALLVSARKHNDLESFYGYIQWVIQKRRSASQGKSSGVNFMSMHKSKGLEFHTVYIIGASDKIVPYYTAKSTDEIAEECRLLHVAVTRAKEELLISSPSTFRGENTAVSRFILSLYQ